MFDYSKLEGKIMEIYKTNYKFAEAIGISKASISAKLNKGRFYTNRNP